MYVYIYIYIYIYTVFSVSSLTTNWVLWFLSPFLLFFFFFLVVCTCRCLFKPVKLRQILPQTEHCRSLWLTWMSLGGVTSWTWLWIWLSRPASEGQFSTYFTVDVVTLWNWRSWSLFAFTNLLFVSCILNTTVVKVDYTHINQFAPLISIQCHFSHRSSDMLICIRENFTESLNLFFGFHAFLFPSHISL